MGVISRTIRKQTREAAQTSTDRRDLEQLASLSGEEHFGAGADIARRRLNRMDEADRLRRLAGLRRSKPGLAATILTGALGVGDDDDNIRRPTLLGV